MANPLRYSRQTRLPGWGQDGQDALSASAALVVGLGGTGTVAARHLAGAGVGRIGLSDPDKVDVSNLHRQILYDADAVGASKAFAAKAALERVNAEVRLVLHEEGEALAGYDIVLDCTDNFPSRFRLHAAAFAARLPLVYAAAEGFLGQVAIFTGYAADMPCLHCFVPLESGEARGPEEGCRGVGILGPVAGTVGAVAAAEALKFLLNIGRPLAGRLFLYDAREAEARVVRIPKDKECRFCGL
jgi:molybdopterin/thiamine biosynthesis adenylyltransferase